jgi:uncharacterized protein YjbJ (UPF0337 family)
MDEDRAMGTARNLGGRAQEGFGRVTGDARSQAEGAVNRAAGAAQDLYGQAKDSVSDAAAALSHGAMTAEDYVRQTIEQRPYTVAFAALCVGWLIGRFGRRDY